ncbi:hypothetical protein [Pseudomonas citronellolis]|uniref:hypothetical protein n=1 Tax=Pseudomonas citronellolis TaxID=53408 RepID=UPI00248DED3F|nr:hypothetical protein [Pseudomonas citronellolis]
MVSASGAQLADNILGSLVEHSEGSIAGLRLWLLAHSDELVAKVPDYLDRYRVSAWMRLSYLQLRGVCSQAIGMASM